jgi:hypothetical protein
MKTILIIFVLTVQSSYVNDSEVVATTQEFDTIQFLATHDGTWRIKTFATDQDVHVWSIDVKPSDIIDLAKANTNKHYGDVLSKTYVLETSSGIEGIRTELKKLGLEDNLEVAPSGFFFWTPKGTSYRTKSEPE